MLWPEAEANAGKASLSTELSWLRRRLERPGMDSGSVIVADRYQIGLSQGSIRTDVGEFLSVVQAAREATGQERIERLRAAATLGRGELLPGLYEDWVLAERDRLLDTYLHALVDLSSAVGDADPAGAIDWLRTAVAADPLRDDIQ